MAGHGGGGGHAGFGVPTGIVNEVGGVSGGLGAAAGEVADFLGDDGEAFAGFAGAGGFDGGVEGEQVGLEGDFVDGMDDLGGLAGGGLDLVDGAGHVLHGIDAAGDEGGGLLHHGVGLTGVVGVLAGHGGHFLEGGGAFFEAGGLFGGALGELLAGGGDLGGAGGDLIGAAGEAVDDLEDGTGDAAGNEPGEGTESGHAEEGDEDHGEILGADGGGGLGFDAGVLQGGQFHDFIDGLAVLFIVFAQGAEGELGGAGPVAGKEGGNELPVAQVEEGEGGLVGLADHQILHGAIGEVAEPDLVTDEVFGLEGISFFDKSLEVVGAVFAEHLEGDEVGFDDVFRGREDIGDEVFALDDLEIDGAVDAEASEGMEGDEGKGGEDGHEGRDQQQEFGGEGEAGAGHWDGPWAEAADRGWVWWVEEPGPAAERRRTVL